MIIPDPKKWLSIAWNHFLFTTKNHGRPPVSGTVGNPQAEADHQRRITQRDAAYQAAAEHLLQLAQQLRDSW
jgi:hypothetical protein